MRLLNVNSLKFEEFVQDDERPSYVIASHRWRGNEITYQLFRYHLRDPQIRESRSCHKVRSFCDFIKRNIPGIEWLWIDTCCINKESDRELSEAINSMFRWYEGAFLCIAYLDDVAGIVQGEAKAMQDLGESEWFRRGWTLQELLAPKRVVFLSSNWEVIGQKSPVDGSEAVTRRATFNFQGKCLNKELSKITGIPENVLANYKESETMAIEDKLHWRQNRKTTRIEDEAYCMLGICGVSMSPIYGERGRAHVRLKEEIKREKARIANGSRGFVPPTLPNSFIAPANARVSVISVDWRRVADNHNAEGNRQYRAGNLAAAVKQYTQAIDTMPDSWQYVFNRSAVYMTMSHFAEALEDAEKARQLNPSEFGIVNRIEKIKIRLDLATPVPGPSELGRARRLKPSEAVREQEITGAENDSLSSNARPSAGQMTGNLTERHGPVRETVSSTSRQIVISTANGSLLHSGRSFLRDSSLRHLTGLTKNWTERRIQDRAVDAKFNIALPQPLSAIREDAGTPLEHEEHLPDQQEFVPGSIAASEDAITPLEHEKHAPNQQGLVLGPSAISEDAGTPLEHEEQKGFVPEPLDGERDQVGALTSSGSKQHVLVDDIALLRTLVEERYRLDCSIWSNRNVLKCNRPIVEAKCLRADIVLQRIYEIVDGWEPDRYGCHEEWEIARKIKDGIIRGQDRDQHAIWMSLLPWDRSAG